MRTSDESIVRTALLDIPSEFGPLLTGPLDPEQMSALSESLERVRRGDYNSEFQSAAPGSPASGIG